jgi:cell wall-associated NlpC family hydrolase
VQPTRRSPRRRSRAVLAVTAALTAAVTGVLAPSAATAAPGSAAEAQELAAKAAQQLTAVDEQVRAAEIDVAEQQQAAAQAAKVAAAAQAKLDAFEPQLRAIAQSGYAGTTQSRVAAFLTSESADDLVQQIQTIDLIADHTNLVITEVAAAQDIAEKAQAEADAAKAKAEEGLAALEKQKADLQRQVDAYQADFARLTAQEQAAVTAAVAGPTLAAPSVDSLPLAPSSAAGVAIQTALAQVGDPYVWSGTGPDGFDCSGLTSYAYAAAGVALPHSSRAQSDLGTTVARSDLQPGDLVFFYSPISHVGLYIGNGMMVHARTYGQPVAVTSVDQAGYRFAKRIVG